MTLCPIALMSGCRSCSMFSICPLKSVIGDYHPLDDELTRPSIRLSDLEEKKKESGGES